MKNIYEIRYRDVTKFRKRTLRVKASSVEQVRKYYREYLEPYNLIDDIVLLDEKGNEVQYY